MFVHVFESFKYVHNQSTVSAVAQLNFTYVFPTSATDQVLIDVYLGILSNVTVLFVSYEPIEKLPFPQTRILICLEPSEL